ncbi:MAG: hypothetical protein ACYDA6_01580 [Solirubrobacteraceae bacterium]
MFTYSLSGLTLQSPPDAPEEVEENETTARSAIYKMLGSFFASPGRDTYEAVRDGAWATELGGAVALLPYHFDAGSVMLADSMDADGYVAEYERLFGSDDGATPLRAGGLAEDAKVRREYEYFGLATGGVDDDAGRPADHLSTQCDFMQFLTFREAAPSACA